MDQIWKTVDLFVPAAFTHREATEYVDSHIRSIAEAGDFIQEIRHGAASRYSNDWYRWTSYLPGPPTVFEQ